MNVQRARCTAGKLGQATELAKVQQDALSVQGVCFVNATLCKPFVLVLLLILTLKRMVSLLLKSQVLHPSSTAGCQMSLVQRSGL